MTTENNLGSGVTSKWIKTVRLICRIQLLVHESVYEDPRPKYPLGKEILIKTNH